MSSRADLYTKDSVQYEAVTHRGRPHAALNADGRSRIFYYYFELGC